MVIDRVNGLSIPRYLVYDIIKFEGIDLSREPFFPTRLQCIKVDITGKGKLSWDLFFIEFFFSIVQSLGMRPCQRI